MSDTLTDLEKLLIRHEGLQNTVYRCPAGKLTIGVGRNLEANGITDEEALLLLRNDIRRCEEQLDAALGYWRMLSPPRMLERGNHDLYLRTTALRLSDSPPDLAALLEHRHQIEQIRLRRCRRRLEQRLDFLRAHYNQPHGRGLYVKDIIALEHALTQLRDGGRERGT